MFDVFLSYAREDQARAGAVAQSLQGAGFSVFWDREVPAGARIDELIGKAIDSTAVVIVLSTFAAVESEWIRAEADVGRRQNKLLPIVLDDVEPPLAFVRIQSTNLRDWDGSPAHPGLRTVVEAVFRHTRGEERRLVPPNAPGEAAPVDLRRSYTRVPRAAKSKIFIAHARADKPRLRPILQTLIDHGFQLWVDKPQQIGLGSAYESRLAADRIQYGQDWRESIRRTVGKANALLAFWSEDAVNGRREQFHYEVYMAMMERKLHRCRIDSVPFTAIGMPHSFDQIADLSQVSAGDYHAELDYLMQDICERDRHGGASGERGHHEATWLAYAADRRSWRLIGTPLGGMRRLQKACR